MKRLTLILLFFLWPCMAITARAADPLILPDKPQPQPSGKIRNAEDREFWIEAGALGSAWTLDTISTHDSFAAKSSRYEIGGFFNGSRSVPKIMGAWAAVDVGAVVVSYEWKKHVRNRYLHPLWRVPLLVGTVEHDRAAVANWSLGK